MYLSGCTNLHAHKNRVSTSGSERSRSTSTGASQGWTGTARPWAYAILTVPSATQANEVRIARNTNLFFSCSFLATMRRKHGRTGAQQESSTVRHICWGEMPPAGRLQSRRDPNGTRSTCTRIMLFRRLRLKTVAASARRIDAVELTASTQSPRTSASTVRASSLGSPPASRAQLRKHPQGGDAWPVYRLGCSAL